MAVDSNFERLEQEVNRLVEVLGRLRHENAELKARVDGLTTENDQLRSDAARLQQLETQYREATETREAIKGRIETILAKLDSVEV